MDLNINGAEFVTNVASTTSAFLGQISPVVYLVGGVLFAFFVAVQILDTIDYNNYMKRARETSDETSRLLDG